ncbi:MAG: hypothetical protein Q8862_07410 [Bacteroidota bacterium]|nr:hypothetical protein [Bacteroidota bacterium]MDP4205984.1 hypothetical protein [Bacteroidota bacterium]
MSVYLLILVLVWLSVFATSFTSGTILEGLFLCPIGNSGIVGSVGIDVEGEKNDAVHNYVSSFTQGNPHLAFIPCQN